MEVLSAQLIFLPVVRYHGETLLAVSLNTSFLWEPGFRNTDIRIHIHNWKGSKSLVIETKKLHSNLVSLLYIQWLYNLFYVY